jgi:restriction endonuclease S subunit
MREKGELPSEEEEIVAYTKTIENWDRNITRVTKTIFTYTVYSVLDYSDGYVFEITNWTEVTKVININVYATVE